MTSPPFSAGPSASTKAANEYTASDIDQDQYEHEQQQSHQQTHDDDRPYNQGDDLYQDEEDDQDERYEDDHFEEQEELADQEDVFDRDDSDLPPLPMSSESFLNEAHSFVNNPQSDDEREMRRKLMDVESSFLPEMQSARASNEENGFDDTYLNIRHQPDQGIPPIHEHTDEDATDTPSSHVLQQPSSPAAAAAERFTLRSSDTLRRPPSNGEDLSKSFQKLTLRSQSSRDLKLSSSSRELPKPAEPPRSHPSVDLTASKPEEVPLPASDRSLLDVSSLHSASARLQKRPSYLSQRNQSHVSAISNADTEYSTGDYALQTGGAIPDDHSFGHTRPLSRLPSLGSVVSAMSRESEPNPPPPLTRANSVLANIRAERALGSLEEEDKASNASDPITPRPPANFAFSAPTDTIITRHVQNIQVPDTVAKEYHQRNRSVSPEKRPASSSNALTFNNRPGGNLTLKEQNSKIDKLTKENFDLKLKIHFLDQALQDRSDEGVKDMINKNVQFQTDLAHERKENQTLRRKIRELEKRLKQQEQDLADARRAAQEAAGSGSNEELEYEIFQLTEELDRKQVQITRLTAENLAKEAEKRRMKEYMNAMNDRRGPNLDAVEEESEMWKDLINNETARREQAEEDNRRLREEIFILKNERNSESNRGLGISRVTKLRSQSIESEAVDSRSGAKTASSATMVDQLQHENAELRRDLGAQTSMLTSRNRERERLQQEIEDLKILTRKGDNARSLAGDSILDRSVSRQQQHQRSTSRLSARTGATQMSDTEREEWEQREGTLRDENATLKMEMQEMQREFNDQTQLILELEEAVQISEAELESAVGDLTRVQNERDEAIQALRQAEREIEQVRGEYEKLRIEAVAAIEDLEDSLDKADTTQQNLAAELKEKNDDFLALQRELRNLNTSLVQLEDDRATAIRRIEMLEQEIEDANSELDTVDKKLQETNQKNQRLEVQSESLHSEIAFLREEQEGDKIKIGDLENALNAAQQMIQDEKEKMQELEDSLIEERRQREIVDNQSKQDVQQIINNLNAETAKSKDEVRQLRRNLTSKESEASTFRSRLEELENNLRRVLGDLSGRRTSWLQEIQRLQADLENTIHDLDEARSDIAEKDRLLRNRDVLLESSGLESRRLSELLDKERAARRKDLHQFEQSQRGQSTKSRAMAQHESRAAELENARSQDRRKMMALEQQFRDQLLERNTLLLTLWNRLSNLCGNDWAELHNLVNGEATTVEVIARSLPGFQRNITDAVKTIESLLSNFRSRIRNLDKSLHKDYQTLEQSLDTRIKRMDLLERAVKDAQAQIEAQAQEQAHLRSTQNINRTSTRSNEEIAKLKQEVKVLKAEIKFHKQHPGAEGSNTGTNISKEKKDSGDNTLRPPSMATSLLRHHSSSAVETLQQQTSQTPAPRQSSIVIATPPLQPSEQRWIHRLKELERRLKAEREGRLLDRKGARQRLEERDTQLEDLRTALERERDRRSSLGEYSEEEDVGEGRDSRLSRGSRVGGRQHRDGSLD